jgi:hypothetical protein
MKRAKSQTRKRTQPKYFTMEEIDQGGGWSVTKKRNGFCLSGSEVGLLGEGCKTICEALNVEGNIFGGSDVRIDTNIELDELLQTMNSRAFATLLHNLDHLVINSVEIDAQAFRNFLSWYAETSELTKKSSERAANHA